MRTTLFAYPAKLSRDRAGRYLVHFRDLPEALTDGATEAEALTEAADCLSEALMSRIADREEIPAPSTIKRGEHRVAPEPTVALKAALYKVAKESKVSAAELARRLKVDHKEARRLLDPRHRSKLPRLTAALQALGYNTAIVVHDASRRDRILPTPTDAHPRPMRPGKAARIEPG
ncbi:MAG: type II toxin-antitoxin system HicB family antitoxin [Pseudomonadota bacterium]